MIRRAGYCALSAILLAVPIHRESLAVFGGVGLVPLLLGLRRARHGTALAWGAFVGVAYGVLIAPWIPGALRALGSSPLQSFAGLLWVCAWVGPLVFGAVGLTNRLTRGWATGGRALAVAASVFATEWILSSTWWGVPWGLLGYSQRGNPGVAQLAAVGGVPLISALLTAMQVALADALSGRRGARRLAVAGLAAWAVLSLAGLPLARAMRPANEAGERFALLVLQPDLPRGERWAPDLQRLNLSRVERFAASAVGPEPQRLDALLLPENLLTTPADAEPALAEALDTWLRELDRPVLAGLALSASPRHPQLYRSAVVWLEPGRGITARIDKERAIPLLESSRRFPGDRWLAGWFGSAASWQKVQESDRSETLGGPVPLAPVLCYEALFPGIAARRRTEETVALVNLADDGWVEGAMATRQLADIARFRAIEQRLPLVRVAHGGLSTVIDAFGQIEQELPLDTYASMRVTLAPAAPPRLGERLAILALPVLGFVVVGWLWHPVARWLPRTSGGGSA